MTDTPPILAECNDFLGVLRAMRARAEQLKISRATIDSIAGIDGHSGKMLADPPNKIMGISNFGLILQALGLKLLIVEDAEQMRKIASRLIPRCERNVRRKVVGAGGKHGPVTIILSRRHMRRIAAMGGHARKLKLQPWRRRAIARRAANKRWGNDK